MLVTSIVSLPYAKKEISISATYYLWSINAFNLDQIEILSFLNTKMLDWSKLKQTAVDIVKCI